MRGPILFFHGFEVDKKGFRVPKAGIHEILDWVLQNGFDVYALQLQHVFECFFVQHTAYIEGAKFPVTGTNFVKTHFVD